MTIRAWCEWCGDPAIVASPALCPVCTSVIDAGSFPDYPNDPPIPNDEQELAA